MKNLLIIGAGGFGREIYELAMQSVGYNTEFQIKGFLDKNSESLKDYPQYPQVISDEDSYQIQEEDVFVVAMGDIAVKKKIIDKLQQRGAKFLTLIHKTATVSPTAKIGPGTVIEHYAHIGSCAEIGANSLIQTYSVVAHDCKIGCNVRIDARVVCVGGVQIEDNVILHTSAVVNHGVTVHQDAVVGACSFVISDVEANTTVFGAPARKLISK